MGWYTNPKVWSFAGGVAVALIGGAVAKLPQARDAAVKVVAKGMEIQQCANEGVQNIKDDAADLAEEARLKAKIDAARADRRAEIEARVREQVEAEMAAEDEKAAKEAEAAETAGAGTTSVKKTTRKTVE